MSTFQIQFTLPYFTNIPEDVVTNVWHFQEAFIGGPSTTDFNNLRDDLTFFYNDCYNQATPMLAPWINAAASSMKAYDLADPTPRAPKYQSTCAISALNQPPSSGFPPEMAICLSYQGDHVSGQPQARRRGRVFIGGLAYLDAGDASHFPNVSSTIRADFAANATALKTMAAGHGWIWVVWSRTDNAAVVVTNGWVDNAADTQRRRGNAATARTLWS